MPEKNVPFVYSINESVEWAAEHIAGMRMLCYPESVDRRIDEMRERGWDNQEILRRCSVISSSTRTPQVPLHEVVQRQHPILQEWELNDIRAGLYRAAINKIAEDKVRLFEGKTIPFSSRHWTGEPHPEMLQWMQERITFLEIYAHRLAQVYSKPHGIRNR